MANALVQRRAAKRASATTGCLATGNQHHAYGESNCSFLPYLSSAFRCLKAASKRSFVASETFGQSTPAFSEK